MKYTWIEEIEEVTEMVLVVGDDGAPIHDENGEAQYEEVITLVPTGGGEVTGVNRGPIDGERLGNESPKLFTNGYHPDYYRVVDYNLVPLNKEEVDSLKAIEDKRSTFMSMIDKVDETNRIANLKNFIYDNDGSVHEYYADRDTLDTIEGNCLSMIAKGGSLSDPVPAPEGVWKTADLSEDGVTPHYEPMTVVQFLGLTDALTQRGVSNFAVKEFHKNNLKGIYANLEMTSEDLEAYDYTVGWVE